MQLCATLLPTYITADCFVIMPDIHCCTLPCCKSCCLSLTMLFMRHSCIVCFQNMRVDAYALTTNLPPRLRKAYHQQFTPRVGRLVVHHQHHHHPISAHAGGSWPRGDNSQPWLHLAQGFKVRLHGVPPAICANYCPAQCSVCLSRVPVVG